MSDDDFPAAHSMDTEWFAVDAHGHVACFESGEAGAVPLSAMVEDEQFSIDELIMQLRPEAGIDYFVDDLLAEPGGPVYEYSWETDRFETKQIEALDGIDSVLLYLADETLFSPRDAGPVAGGFLARLMAPARTPRTERSPVVRLHNSQHILGFVADTLPMKDLKNWIASGVVKRAWVHHSLSPERIGIFKYSHGDAFENWIAGPYVRSSQPARPVKLDELPEEFQRIAQQTHLADTDFSRWRAVDPRAAGECVSWDQAWVDLDGTVHRPEEEP